MKKIFTKEVAKDIVEVFEDLLEDNNISIPDRFQEGNDDEARLYGQAYDGVMGKVECMIIELVQDLGVEIEFDTWNGDNWFR